MNRLAFLEKTFACRIWSISEGVKSVGFSCTPLRQTKISHKKLRKVVRFFGASDVVVSRGSFDFNIVLHFDSLPDLEKALEWIGIFRARR